MACTESEALTAYLDGELPAAERSRFEGHLASCPTCPGELALLRAMQGQLGRLPAIEPSAQLRRDVLNALPTGSTFWGRLRLPLLVGGGLAAAAALALAIPGKPQPRPEDLALADNLEVVENLGAVQTADLSDEDLEVIANLDQLEAKE